MTLHRRFALIALVIGLDLGAAQPAARGDIIYVTNAINNTIEKFTPDGAGTLFANSGLASPEGIAADSGGNIYAANVNTTIEKYTPAGTPSVFSTAGFAHRSGLAFDTGGNLYATAFSNNAIEKFLPVGMRSVFVADPGDHSVLWQPTDVKFDSDGNMYVTNVSWVEKITPAGVPSLFINTGVASPFGLAIDDDDNFYVSFRTNNRIEKYDSAGNDLGVFASDPGDGSILSLPEGMTFDSAGTLYVVNHGPLDFIESFSPDGTPSRFVTDPGDHSLLDSPQFIIAIPEPATFVLFGVGGAALIGAAGRKRRRK